MHFDEKDFTIQVSLDLIYKDFMMTDHHTHDNPQIDIVEPKTPTWAKIFAPIVALLVLSIQYDALTIILS